MKILIVDDERSFGVMLGVALRRLGHEPQLALHPSDALEILDDEVDAVILDIDLPGLTGVELAYQIRELRPQMPVAFCTGSGPRDGLASEAAHLGPVIRKGWTLAEIEALVIDLEQTREAARAFARGRDHHRAERFRVHLPVNMSDTEDDCRAENLGAGGLFVRGAHTLAPGQQVRLSLELPGMDTFDVDVKVVYVLSPDAAERYHRQPGAGMCIVSEPPAFRDALSYYLHRVRRRKDFLIFATDAHCRKLLREAGFSVRPAPPPQHLLSAVADSRTPVLAVVVTRSEAIEYTEAAALGGDASLVHAIDYYEELDESIADFDRGVA